MRTIERQGQFKRDYKREAKGQLNRAGFSGKLHYLFSGIPSSPDEETAAASVVVNGA